MSGVFCLAAPPGAPGGACDWYELARGSAQCPPRGGASIPDKQGCLSWEGYRKCLDEGNSCDPVYYNECPARSDDACTVTDSAPHPP